MSIFNFSQKEKEFDLYEDSALDIKNIIAPSAIKVNSKDIELGDKYARTFAIVSYPRYLNEGWFTDSINLSREFDIAIHIHPIESTEALRNFRKKVAQVESQIIERESKGLVRDPILDTAHEDLESLRDKIQQATEKIFDVGIYITMYGKTKEDLQETEKEFRSLLEGRLIF